MSVHKPILFDGSVLVDIHVGKHETDASAAAIVSRRTFKGPSQLLADLSIIRCMDLTTLDGRERWPSHHGQRLQRGARECHHVGKHRGDLRGQYEPRRPLSGHDGRFHGDGSWPGGACGSQAAGRHPRPRRLLLHRPGGPSHDSEGGADRLGSVQSDPARRAQQSWHQPRGTSSIRCRQSDAGT